MGGQSETRGDVLANDWAGRVGVALREDLPAAGEVFQRACANASQPGPRGDLAVGGEGGESGCVTGTRRERTG